MKKPFLTSSAEFTGDVSIGGNLTVTGTTTSIDTTNLQIEDKNIVLSKSSSPTNAAADGGGITLQASTDKTIIWDATNDSWGLNCNLEVSGDINFTGNLNQNGVAFSSGDPAIWSGDGTSDISYSNGNVGIGTASPTATLHVKGLFAAPATTGSSANGIARFGQAAGVGVLDIGFGDPYSWLQSRASSDYSVNYDLALQPNGGKVGIGTTNPEASFVVSEGSIGIEMGYSTGAALNYIQSYDRGSSAFVKLTLNNSITIDSNGNTGIGTASPAEKLEVAGGGISFEGEANDVVDTGKAILDTDNSDTMRLKIHGANNGAYGGFEFISKKGDGSDPKTVLKINEAGNVGIGTTSPEHSLHIFDNGSSENGSIKLGGSAASLGLEISYDQTSDTTTRIVANPTYTNDAALLKIAVDGDRNANQLVLDGKGNVGIGTSPSVELHVKAKASSSQSTLKLQGGTTSGYCSAVVFANSDDTDNGAIYYNADDNFMRFNVAGLGQPTERMRINSSGNVGIGATNPNVKLEVVGDPIAAGSEVSIVQRWVGEDGKAILEVLKHSDTGLTEFRNNAYSGGVNGDYNFSDGNVGIGTVDPKGALDIYAVDRNAAGNLGDANHYAIVIRNNSQTNQGNGIAFTNDDAQGVGGAILHIDKGSNNLGDLAFYTKAIGTGPPIERARIDSDGNVGIGTTNPDNSDWNSSAKILHLHQADANNAGAMVKCSSGAASLVMSAGSKGYLGTSSNSDLAIYSNSNPRMTIKAGGNVGIGITDPGSYKLYVNGWVFASSGFQSSDDRLKHNEQTIVGALDTLAKITPKKYIKTSEMYDADHDFELDDDGNPIDEDGESVDHFIEAGIIAQELLNVPELKFAVSDETVDDDGNIAGPYGVNYNSLLTYAIAAIQEQQAMIENLKEQNEQLKSRIENLENN